MNETADCIIIGGGVMGASIAYHLARQGMGRVVLLERHALCTGTTGRSGAIVRQHYSNDFTIRMARESLRIFQQFDDLVGGDCGFLTTGLLVMTGEQGADALRANVDLQQEQDVNTRLITAADISEVAPGYSSEGVTVACYEPYDIYLRPDIGGMTLVGSTADVLTASDPDHYPQGLSEKEIAHFQAMAAKSMPALARAVPRGGWAGIYDDSVDNHPILDRLTAYESLYCSAGFSGHGFKLSTLIGPWMAHYILTGQKPADMEHFAFDRFVQGREIRPRYPSGVLG